MGWITRRVVGAIVFSIIAGVLGAVAVSQGYITGEPTLSTACGVSVLGIALLVSFSVTSSMKRTDRARKAAVENARRWQEYYAAAYPEYYRKP